MGGNVFFGSSPIKKENIKPTLHQFFKEFKRIFPKADAHFKSVRTLGSVGKKDESGDIDLALDERSFDNIKDWGLDQKRVQELFDQFKKRAKTASKQQLMKRAVLTGIADKIEEESEILKVDKKQTGSGALFCQFPQYNESGKQVENKEVQIDVNVGNLDWLSFAYYSDKYEGNVKGLHRTQLMLSLFSHKGYTFSHNYGVKSKESGEIVAKNPKEALKLLSDLYRVEFTEDILNNYFKLQEFLQKHLHQDELNQIYDRFLKILDSTRCDIPEDLQNYWLDNQDRLDLKGKFLPDSSKLFPFKA